MFGLQPYSRRGNDLTSIFDSLERDFFGMFPAMQGSIGFRTDIKDKGDHYLMEAELPGFNKEDIKVELNGDTLNVYAEHKEDRQEEKDGYLRRERHYGSYARSFDMTGIDTDSIAGNYNNGVLELKLPKKVNQNPGAKSININ